MRRMEHVARRVDAHSASRASSPARSRALTSTTVVRVDACSAISTDGATANASLAARQRLRLGGGGGSSCASARVDRLDQPRAMPRVGIAAPARVRDQQIVERHAVARGVDARVDDRRRRPRPARRRCDRTAPARRARTPTDPRCARPGSGSAWTDATGGRRCALRRRRSGAHWRPATRAARRANSCRAGAGPGRAPRRGVQPSVVGQRGLPVARPARDRPRCLWPSRSRSSAASNKVRSNCRFHSFHVPGPTARISTTVSISSSRSRSGLCTVRDEIVDRLGIGKVAAEGGVRHQQVVAHQPGDRLGLAPRRARSAGTARARSRRPARYGRRRGPWRCRGAAPRRRACGATRSAGTRRSTADDPRPARRARSRRAARSRGCVCSSTV